MISTSRVESENTPFYVLKFGPRVCLAQSILCRTSTESIDRALSPSRSFRLGDWVQRGSYSKFSIETEQSPDLVRRSRACKLRK